MFLNLTMLVALVLTILTAMAAEPYAVLSSDNTTLTFYDDNKFLDIKYGSEAAVREADRMAVEGKDYVVQNSDIMHFRFYV